MPSRRDFIAGSLGALALPAIISSSRAAEAGPIRIGWIPALTGPGAAPAAGFDHGTAFAVSEINAAGGVGGRPLEIVRRDTQGDPSKAINATVELIERQKVVAIVGPLNSGEALAVTPITARRHMPMLHPSQLDTLIDPAKYPNAFRIAPANAQWEAATRHFVVDLLKAKKVAIVGDTTGYGLVATKVAVEDFQDAGCTVVYHGQIDASQTDMTADLMHMKNAGAEAVVVWSITTGMHARLLNARGQQGWDVPFAGHPSIGSGEVRKLLDKPEYWDKVYTIGYRSCSYRPDGTLPPRMQGFMDRIKGKIALEDSSLWWVAAGYDQIALVAAAVKAAGSTEGKAIIDHWNTLKAYPGYYGDYTYTADQHNGYPTEEVVMSVANSFRSGAFSLAPGYS